MYIISLSKNLVSDQGQCDTKTTNLVNISEMFKNFKDQ